MWGAAFAVNALLGVVAQQTDSPTAPEWLNWILPIALIVGAFTFTAWYAEHARARAMARGAARVACLDKMPLRARIFKHDDFEFSLWGDARDGLAGRIAIFFCSPGLVRTEMTEGAFPEDAPWTPPQLAPKLVDAIVARSY